MKFHPLLTAFCLLFGIASALVAGEPLLSLSDELEHITGKPIELHASPGAYGDRSLPLICEALASAFHDAATDSETKRLLGRIVHSVVIDEFYGTDDAPHVVLSDGMLTVQSLHSDEAARSLYPLILEVLRHAGVRLR